MAEACMLHACARSRRNACSDFQIWHSASAACEPSEVSVLQIWFQEDFRNSWDACPWEEDLAVCQQVSPYTLYQYTQAQQRGRCSTALWKCMRAAKDSWTDAEGAVWTAQPLVLTVRACLVCPGAELVPPLRPPLLTRYQPALASVYLGWYSSADEVVHAGLQGSWCAAGGGPFDRPVLAACGVALPDRDQSWTYTKP